MSEPLAVERFYSSPRCFFHRDSTTHVPQIQVADWQRENIIHAGIEILEVAVAGTEPAPSPIDALALFDVAVEVRRYCLIGQIVLIDHTMRIVTIR